MGEQFSSLKIKNLQLAVTEFALPCPRTGSIQQDSGYGGAPNLGSEIHAVIQAERLRSTAHYVAEKWVTHTFEVENYRLQVSGRMDGFVLGAPPQIEEYKSTYDIDGLEKLLKENPQHPYWLQLKTYGYIHYLRTGQEPRLALVLVCSRKMETRLLEGELAPPAFENWLKLRLNEIVDEQKDFEKRERKRKKIWPLLTFPFPEPRPGQQELVATISERLKGKARLLLQAPTGLGKTMGVLYPSLIEAFKRGQKVIYLTAKNSQHSVAEDAVRRLQEGGHKIRSVTLTAKRKMCLKDETLCNPEYCEFARNYYDKVAAGDLTRQLGKKKRLTPARLKKFGREHQVCPFELQLEMVPKADVVICDYNYVYSPRNSRGRLTQSGYGKTSPPNLIIDEAHNLPSRANEYFSARLSRAELEEWSQDAEPMSLSFATQLDRFREKLSELFDALDADDSKPRILLNSDLRLESLASAAQELMAKYLESGISLKTPDPVFQINNMVGQFYEASMNLGESFFTSYSRDAKGPALKITCCDASDYLSEMHAHFHNVVAFSATLKPFDYFTRLLGFKTEITHCEEFTSPFPRENRKIIIIPQISTKMRDRESNRLRIREVIARVTELKRGNYFVFFPSFDFMYQVARDFDLPEFQILLQRRDMSLKEIQFYIETLRESEPTLIFAVQGGVFAEGVDYPGDMIIGALIVGPALPSFDFEREQMRNYFDRREQGTGFDFAYTYPAMSRVVQSAGRVIRSNTDRGLIVLMDRRFTHGSYTKSMPSDWLHAGLEPLVSRQILEDVRNFWSADEP